MFALISTHWTTMITRHQFRFIAFSHSVTAVIMHVSNAIFQLSHEIRFVKSSNNFRLKPPEMRSTQRGSLESTSCVIINQRSRRKQFILTLFARQCEPISEGTFRVNDLVLQRNYIDKYSQMKLTTIGEVLFYIFISCFAHSYSRDHLFFGHGKYR